MLRKAKIDDLEVLRELFVEENRHNHALAPDVVALTEDVLLASELQEMINDEHTFLYVCEANHHVVGLLLGNVVDVKGNRWSQARCYAHIEELIVTKSARGNGYAQALVARFERWATERGASSIELNVWCNNEIAINFYSKLGFKEKQTLMSKSVK